jgi:predicted secreted protein
VAPRYTDGDYLVTPDSNIFVTVGTEFTLSLKSTPTTGYAWEVQTLPEGIQLLGSDYENEKPVHDIRPGASVMHLFRFRALTTGQHMITFMLKRPWESDAIEFHTATVHSN